jgi:hypothetical protein
MRRRIRGSGRNAAPQKMIEAKRGNLYTLVRAAAYLGPLQSLIPAFLCKDISFQFLVFSLMQPQTQSSE